MANYTIIGGDKKEYGPVSLEDMRQWIAEGRLDGNSLARSDSDTEWRPLAAFPEFASSFSPGLGARPKTPPPLGTTHGAPTPASSQEVKNAATALIIVGALSLLLGLWNTLNEIIQPEKLDEVMAKMSAMPQFADPQVQRELQEPQVQSLLHLAFNQWLKVGFNLLTVGLSALVLLGGLRMLNLRNHEFACLAAILAMIPCLTPCPCCVLGLPIGIWVLLVLRKPGVKSQFH